MTEVVFHAGVADPVAFAGQLLRRAARQGVRVQVTAPPEVLSLLDRILWTAEALDFVPHVRMPSASAAGAARTPIWLTPAALHEGAPRVLMNLGAERAPEAAALDRVIEIVSSDPDLAAEGRKRWRAYTAMGLAPRLAQDGAQRNARTYD